MNSHSFKHVFLTNLSIIIFQLSLAYFIGYVAYVSPSAQQDVLAQQLCPRHWLSSLLLDNKNITLLLNYSIATVNCFCYFSLQTHFEQLLIDSVKLIRVNVNEIRFFNCSTSNICELVFKDH